MKIAVVCLFVATNIAYVLSGGETYSPESSSPVPLSSSPEVPSSSVETSESSQESSSSSSSIPSSSPELSSSSAEISESSSPELSSSSSEIPSSSSSSPKSSSSSSQQSSSSSQKGPCGTIVYYNPKKNPVAPVGVSISAGKYYDNSFSYVGLGNSSCANEPFVPARLATGLISGPYVTCGKARLSPGNVAAYVESHPYMEWVAVDAVNQTNVYGAVKYQGAHFTYLFGRVNITHNGKTYQDVSKVHIGDNGSVAGMVYIPTPGGNEALITSGYEILVCAEP